MQEGPAPKGLSGSNRQVGERVARLGRLPSSGPIAKESRFRQLLADCGPPDSRLSRHTPRRPVHALPCGRSPMPDRQPVRQQRLPEILPHGQRRHPRSDDESRRQCSILPARTLESAQLQHEDAHLPVAQLQTSLKPSQRNRRPIQLRDDDRIRLGSAVSLPPNLLFGPKRFQGTAADNGSPLPRVNHVVSPRSTKRRYAVSLRYPWERCSPTQPCLDRAATRRRLMIVRCCDEVRLE